MTVANQSDRQDERLTMLCIVSDTHENLPAIRGAVARMKALKPELVVHCGDIISPPVLRFFEGLPLRIALGNNDGERAGLLKMAQSLGFGEPKDELEFELDGKSFYAYHGTSANRLAAAIASQKYDYVLTGHTHALRDERVGRTRVINPGALFLVSRPTFAVLDPVTDRLEIVDVVPEKA